MRFAYRPYEVTTRPGITTVYRPVIPVQVVGPRGRAAVLGLLDTGSDVTILPAFVLDLIGAEGAIREQWGFRGVGEQVLTGRSCEVTLALDHPDGGCRWNAQAVFLPGNTVTILGYEGFLKYFNATFNTERRWISLKPNDRFPVERP